MVLWLKRGGLGCSDTTPLSHIGSVLEKTTSCADILDVIARNRVFMDNK